MSSFSLSCSSCFRLSISTFSSMFCDKRMKMSGENRKITQPKSYWQCVDYFLLRPANIKYQWAKNRHLAVKRHILQGSRLSKTSKALRTIALNQYKSPTHTLNCSTSVWEFLGFPSIFFH